MTQTVLLGDLVDVIKGISYRSADYSVKGKGKAFINLKCVGRGGGFRFDGIKYYAGKMKLSQMTNAGDILIANTDLTQDREVIGSPIIMPELGEEACFSLDLSKLEIKNDSKIDKDYLFYYLKSPLARDYMIAHSSGSTVMHLSVKSVPSMPILLPSIEEQRYIGQQLKLIDEKIELNRKMNETLEQMGQALFRHYFITNPAAKTWSIGTISDLGQVITGKTPSKTRGDFYGNDVPFLKVPDMHNQTIIINTADNLSTLGANSQANKYIPKWSTTVSCIATVGVISLAGKEMQTNQQINSVIPKNENYTFFNYFVLTSKKPTLRSMASSGSAVPNLNKAHFENINIVIPSETLLEEFQHGIKSIFKIIETNLQEIQTLTTLRDTLLPRLISGKLKV
ncbi:restriction endonuclease subunit S [Candidatus Saccharibacteria bacterium]|nr:restriction endonuclease subunit S [Candidatus Saccharibacteria bacterium]MCB9817446.1 restriction endonuclease subunit S [Candidatus Nomurabacteria bacterium]